MNSQFWVTPTRWTFLKLWDQMQKLHHSPCVVSHLHLPFVKAFCSPFCQKFLGAMDLLSGDLQWMGKDDGQAFLVGKEGHHHHHHHHIIRVLRTNRAWLPVYLHGICFMGRLPKFCFVGSVLPTCKGFFTTGFIILKTFFFPSSDMLLF